MRSRRAPVQLRRIEAAEIDADHVDAVSRSGEIGGAANDSDATAR